MHTKKDFNKQSEIKLFACILCSELFDKYQDRHNHYLEKHVEQNYSSNNESDDRQTSPFESDKEILFGVSPIRESMDNSRGFDTIEV